jgi:hypothetical protein
MTSHNATPVGAGNDGAVRAALDRVYAAWADNDADAFVAPYAENTTAPGTPPEGVTVRALPPWRPTSGGRCWCRR